MTNVARTYERREFMFTLFGHKSDGTEISVETEWKGEATWMDTPVLSYDIVPCPNQSLILLVLTA